MYSCDFQYGISNIGGNSGRIAIDDQWNKFFLKANLFVHYLLIFLVFLLLKTSL